MEMILQLAIILIGAKLGGLLSKKLGQPAVLGEIVAGLIMGPYVMGLFETGETFKIISDIGIIVLMFLVGLHINVRDLKKFAEKGSFIAFMGVLFPLVICTWVGLFLGWGLSQSVFFGGILTATSVSITTSTFSEMGAIRSRPSMVILDAAVIDDIMGVVVLTVMLAAFTKPEFDSFGIAVTIAGMLVFFLLLFVFGKKLMPRILNFGRHLDFRVREGMFSLVLALVFIFAFIASGVGLSIVTGAFLLGIIMPHSGIKKVEHEIYAFGYGFAIPIFFTYVGAQLNPFEIILFPAIILLVFAIAFVSKFAGCSLAAKISGFGRRESAVIGIGMVPRLEVATVTASIGLAAGIITGQTFSIIITGLVLTVFVTPPLIKAICKKKHI